MCLGSVTDCDSLPTLLRACKGFDRDLKAYITLQSGTLLIYHIKLNAEDNLAMVA